MRVLVVGLNYAPEPTGIAPYTTALSEGLAARGHDVRVLTAMPHYPEWRIRPGYEGWTRRERIAGVRVRRLRHQIPSPPSGIRRLLSELSFGLRIVTTRWGHPDVVLFVSPALFATALGMLRARLLRPGLPIVTWVQDFYALGLVETRSRNAGGAVARLMHQVEAGVLQNSASVVVIHDRFAATASDMVDDSSRITVVRNWTHLEPVQITPEARAGIRARLGWRDDETIVLHTGAMGAKQDLGNAIRAARLADRQQWAVRFVLMGHGGERPNLEREAGGVERISLVDPLPGEEYQQALAAADVLLVNEHAGLREMAVPSKLTSYFSSGRPIVAATDSQSITAFELATSGAGVRVNPDDPKALLDAVQYVQREAVEFGERGREYMHRVLSEPAAIGRFETLLQALCPRRTRVRVRQATAR
jgi:colanic acid biosynthesis glycosyl transferase WcaI